MDLKVKEGVKVSYHDMFGEVVFVDTQYFVIKIAEHGHATGREVRVCVRWDSQYTVHRPTTPETDPVLLDHLQETYGSQHRDQG